MFFLCRFLRLAGGAGARAHLEKTAFGVEGVAFFACRPFARGAKKRTKDDEKQRKTQLENASKNERRSTREKHQQMSEHERKHAPQIAPKSLPGASWAPGWPQEGPKIGLGGPWEARNTILAGCLEPFGGPRGEKFL